MTFYTFKRGYKFDFLYSLHIIESNIIILL